MYCLCLGGLSERGHQQHSQWFCDQFDMNLRQKGLTSLNSTKLLGFGASRLYMYSFIYLFICLSICLLFIHWNNPIYIICIVCVCAYVDSGGPSIPFLVDPGKICVPSCQDTWMGTRHDDQRPVPALPAAIRNMAIRSPGVNGGSILYPNGHFNRENDDQSWVLWGFPLNSLRETENVPLVGIQVQWGIILPKWKWPHCCLHQSFPGNWNGASADSRLGRTLLHWDWYNHLNSNEIRNRAESKKFKNPPGSSAKIRNLPETKIMAIWLPRHEFGGQNHRKSPLSPDPYWWAVPCCTHRTYGHWESLWRWKMRF